MNQLEQQYQEILHTLDKLLANLGLMLEDYDVEYLTQADLYIEIFKIMFPVLEPVLNADFGEDITDEELIQYLIDVLAKDIIKMDLGHIRGELIAQGDAKNILNFLQLLFEISNMVVEKDDGQKDKRSKKNKNKKLVKSSANSADQTSNNSEQSSLEMNQKYNSVQGINAEFSSSSVAESNREASEAGAEYYEEIVEGQDRSQNKMVFDQHQQMKAMKGDSRGNSRSVSRISEVSKSKESSEYERGIKKLSQKFDDFNPGVVQVKSLVADGAKRGSYTSDDIRELRGENGEEEDELEEEQEVTENEYDQEQQDQHDVRQFTNENEEDEQEEEYEEEEADQGAHQGEQEYYQETNEDDEVIEEEDGFSEHMIKKISKEEVGDDLEYYSSDPINYNPLGNNKRRHSHEPQREVDRAHAVQSVGMKHKQIEHDEDQEQEEYEEEEIEEQEELVEEEDSQRQFYENNDEYVEEDEEVEDQEQEQEEIDPRHAEYREEMEEVAEEEYEEEDTENAEPNEALYPQGYYQAQQAQQVAKKPKGTKGKGKTKKVSKKKSPKAKAVEDFKKPKVEYRPLRPATAGMKRPQTANPSKGKVTKAMPVRSSGRKSESTTSSRSKKMAHSKSEKRLNMDEEQEQSQSQSEVHEDYSEDKGMEPKELSPHGDSQIPSQHGHANEYSGIEEEQEQEEEGYQEQVQQNVFKILSDNVSRVKENLREHRAVEDIPFDDENTVKMIRQQKEQYKQYLKDFVKDHQIKEKKYQQMRELGEKNFHKKVKSEKIRDQAIRREFENQQKSLYFKMRDEKVNYLRRIHKTIFELEKKRIIDEKKEYMEFRKTRNIEACNMIESIKNQYKHKLSILRENNTNQQQERKIASEAQRTFIKTLENELRMDQMKEVERLKDKWRLEKERFDMMIKDEGFLEQKVMQLYKKGVF